MTHQLPALFVTVLPNRPIAVGKSLGMWFGYSLLVGAVAGYVAGLTIGPGAAYLSVFHVVSTVAFAGYSLAILQSAIWWYRGWGYTLRTMFDGLIYALLTGGTGFPSGHKSAGGWSAVWRWLFNRIYRCYTKLPF